MAINYTSYIPRQVIDTGIPLDQAPDFSRLMDRQDWRLNGDNGMNRYQYLTPSDFRYWASQKQEGGDPSQDIQKEKQGASAPKSELEQERERLRAKFQAPLHDENNAWVQSANRGRKAIDSGNELKPTPQVFSKDFATRTLPSGSANAPINYDTLGDDINEKGIQLMRDTGTWSEDELKDPSKINMNWGMHQALDAAGGIRHTQAEYEKWLQYQKWLEQQAKQNYGPVAYQEALSFGVPQDETGFDMTGNSVADYYQMDNALASNEFDSNPSRQSTPISNYDPFDDGRGLRYRGPDNRPDWAKQPLFSEATPASIQERFSKWD